MRRFVVEPDGSVEIPDISGGVDRDGRYERQVEKFGDRLRARAKSRRASPRTAMMDIARAISAIPPYNN